MLYFFYLQILFWFFIGPWKEPLGRRWQRSIARSQCKISNLTFDHGAKIEVSVKCINNVELMEVKKTGPLTIYHEAPNSDLSSLLFYPDNRYTVLEGNANLKVQSNLTHVDFTWGSFDDLSGDVNYETRVRKDDNIIAPWESVGLRNSASRKINLVGKADTFFVDVRAINNGGLKSPSINASISLDEKPPILTGNKLNIV